MLTFKPTAETGAQWSEVETFFRYLGRSDTQKLSQVSNAVRRGFAQNFISESSGDGERWEELSPATVREREDQGYPGDSPILKRSGDYEESFINAGDPDHIEEIILTPSGFRIDVGTSDYRADILEQGGFVDFNGTLVYVPARPVTILGDRQESDVGDALDAFFLSLEG